MVLKDTVPLVWYMSTKKNTADSMFGLKEAGTGLLGGKTQRAEIFGTAARNINLIYFSFVFM
jgi:hypothetical protein